MKVKEKEKTPEEIEYNKAKSSFKRRITSMLSNKGVKAVEYQLEFIRKSLVPLYKNVEVEDAIDIMESKIKEFKLESQLKAKYY